ncbi:MAG: hypothetical protein ACLS28_23240 [Clostridium neonatale]
MFGGTKGTSKPVTVDSNGNLAYADKNGNGFGNPAIPDVSTGNDKTNAESQLSTSLKTEISQGVVVEYNKTATDIFEFTDTKLGDINVMNEISTLINNLGKMSDKTGATTDAEKEAALNYVNGEGLSQMVPIVQIY